MADVYTALRFERPSNVVAEISNAHNGDLDLALSLIDAVKEAGAAAVKFQCYSPDEIVALRGDGPAPAPWGDRHMTMRDLYEKARTPFEWFPQLVARAYENELPWFASVFGPASIAVMQLSACPVYKIAALDSRAMRLLRDVRATGKPIVRSLDTKRVPPKALPNESYLYCPPGYPQPGVDLSRMRRGKFDGLSYHGRQPMVPAAAAVFGARIIEVHVQSVEVPSLLESAVSLSTDQLRSLVETIQTVRGLLTNETQPEPEDDDVG